jgi:putative intracellular protease/amidase
MRVLMPVPDRDFDTTEVAVPWRLLCDSGHTVTFATEDGGRAPACDPRLLTGVVLGRLGAEAEAVGYYRQLTRATEFTEPVSWSSLDVTDFDGMVLPGGHAPGMRQYLGSAELQERVAEFWSLGRPVGAICHGVVVVARATDRRTGRSLLADRTTTCLPKYMERGAYLATAWRLGRYYRTYPAYVEDEVRGVLEHTTQFRRGPRTLRRGTASDDRPAFVVQDGNYLSARWPGDAYLFARRFGSLLEASGPSTTRVIRPDDATRRSSPRDGG